MSEAPITQDPKTDPPGGYKWTRGRAYIWNGDIQAWVPGDKVDPLGIWGTAAVDDQLKVVNSGPSLRLGDMVTLQEDGTVHKITVDQLYTIKFREENIGVVCALNPCWINYVLRTKK